MEEWHSLQEDECLGGGVSGDVEEGDAASPKGQGRCHGAQAAVYILQEIDGQTKDVAGG